MNNKTTTEQLNIELPKTITLITDVLELNAFNHQGNRFYVGIYTDKSLMKFINDTIDRRRVIASFDLIVNEIKKEHPAYVSYIINTKQASLGILGIKILAQNEVEIGVIIQQQFQGHDWSRKIKVILIDYLIKNLNIKCIVTYCNHQNAVVNHINQSIGFTLSKQFKHKAKNHLMNKWVLNQQTIQIEESE